MTHPILENRPATLYNGPARVLSQIRYSPNCWKMTLSVPSNAKVEAGQFVHVRCHDGDAHPILRRPFSFWDVRPAGRGRSEWDLLYTTVGTGTELLAACKKGNELDVLGPLGHGFTPPRRGRTAIFVAGGVGIVPFYLFAKQIDPHERILLFGGRTRSMLYGIEDFPDLDVDTYAATEDGSFGLKGRVTDLLNRTLQRLSRNEKIVYVCGPEPMLEAVMEICRKRRVPCEVSMEKRMGCALGACGACVTTVRDGDDWRYSRICIEGPCYDSAELVPGHV